MGLDVISVFTCCVKKEEKSEVPIKTEVVIH